MLSNRFKFVLAGLVLVTLFGGTFIGQAQQEEGVVGSTHAVLVISRAITEFDMILLANGGVASGNFLNDNLTIEVEGGTSHTVARQEIETLNLSGKGHLKDRIILKSGNTLQGHLETKAFQIRMLYGEKITISKSEVRGVIMQIPAEKGKIGGDLEEPNTGLIKVIKQLVNNPLMPQMLYSLTKYDWVRFNDPKWGLLSGTITRKEFICQTREGKKENFKKDELNILLFAPNVTLAILKNGNYVACSFQRSKIDLEPAFQSDNIKLTGDQLRTILFRVPSLTFGGGG